MRRRVGVGTPRGLQGRGAAAVATLVGLWIALGTLTRPKRTILPVTVASIISGWRRACGAVALQNTPLTTGC